MGDRFYNANFTEGCVTCHPYEDALIGEDPRQVYPCGLCLRAMPPELRHRWSVAHQLRVIKPREFTESVIAVLLWARDRTPEF